MSSTPEPSTDDRLVWDGPLSIADVRHALVTPVRFSEDQTEFVGGVYDADGLVPESRRETENAAIRPVDPPQPDSAARPERLRGTWLYAGWLHLHFGHVLLEGIARLWPLEMLPPNIRVLYHPWLKVTKERAEAAVTIGALLGALGVGWDRVRLIDRSAVVDRLIVPAPAFRINTAAHQRMNELFDTIARTADGQPRDVVGADLRVYLSRRLLPAHMRHFETEDRLEAAFERHGFTVAFPERLPLADQVRLARGADVIAGLDGSALHLVAFARRGTTMIMLKTRDYGHVNQLALNELRHARTIALDVRNSAENDVYAALDAVLTALPA